MSDTDKENNDASATEQQHQLEQQPAAAGGGEEEEEEIDPARLEGFFARALGSIAVHRAATHAPVDRGTMHAWAQEHEQWLDAQKNEPEGK